MVQQSSQKNQAEQHSMKLIKTFTSPPLLLYFLNTCPPREDLDYITWSHEALSESGLLHLLLEVAPHMDGNLQQHGSCGIMVDQLIGFTFSRYCLTVLTVPDDLDYGPSENIVGWDGQASDCCQETRLSAFFQPMTLSQKHRIGWGFLPSLRSRPIAYFICHTPYLIGAFPLPLKLLAFHLGRAME